MSATGDYIAKAEEEAAWREFDLWHAGNTLRDAIKAGDAQAQQILLELEQIERAQR